MEVLLAHSSPVQRRRLKSKLDQIEPIKRCDVASDLSSVFNISEHSVRDTLLIGRAMTEVEEFEVLKLLLDTLGIECILIDDGNVTRPSGSELKLLKAEFEESELIPLLKKNVKGFRRPSISSRPVSFDFDPNRVILIGASTGGIDALLHVLSSFPSHCPPTLVVQHTGGGFKSSLVKLLDKSTQPKVIEAGDGMTLDAGRIVVAAGVQKHLGLGARNGRLISRLHESGPISGHCPSVDFLFESAVPIAAHVSAAILTGMGRDGASGLVALRAAGAETFGQDEATSVVYGMPKAAFELGGVCNQLPLEAIGDALLQSCRLATS